MAIPIMPECCPVRQHTANRVSVGRCWLYLKHGRVCPTHKDVKDAVEKYKNTGEMTNDYELPRDR